jgi:glycosyltransferase involved in cell wall biosynthesis/spore maturation protein CgeB
VDNKYRVLLLDTKTRNPNHYICLAVRIALNNASGVEIVVTADLHDAIAKAVENKCNLFFAFDGEELDRFICARIASACGRSILWVTEDPYELSVNVANAELFDLVFTNESSSVAAYGLKGRHLPLAGAKPFHYRPVNEVDKPLRYDLFFAGTAWPNRVELLKSVLDKASRLSDFKAKIALPTNEHLPIFDLNLSQSQLNWRTAPSDFARFANMSLTTLLLPRVFSVSGNRDDSDTPPPRLFEAALAGTVQLIQSKLNEVESYFVSNEHFLYFDSAEELIDLLGALRGDMRWRNEIAIRAQNRALEHHCYENRIAYVFSEIEKLNSCLDNINLVEQFAQKRPRVAFVAHNVVEQGEFGGVEVYLKNIGNVLGRDFDILLYVPDRKAALMRTRVIEPNGRILRTYNFSKPILPWQLSCSEREDAFSMFLTEFGVDVVHFHHVIGHPPSVIEIAKAVGCLTAFTFHDYYSVCHNYNLLSFRGEYCRPDEISLSQCDVCLGSSYNLLEGSQGTRRAYWDHLIRKTDLLIFNTLGARSLASAIYPAVAEHSNIKILPPPSTEITNIRPIKFSNRHSLKVAVIGNFIPHKGGDVIARVIPLLVKSNIKFHIFGYVADKYSWLNDKQFSSCVYIHGAHQPGALPSEIFDCNVSLHLSIWPETYCLTLSEALDCGLVPVVSDIGALAERVIDGVNGLKIPPNSEGALIQVLHRLSETPGLIEELRSGVSSIGIPRMEDHIEVLRNVYSVMASSVSHVIANQKFPLKTNLGILRRLVPEYWGAQASACDTGQSSTTRPINNQAETSPKTQSVIELMKKGIAHLSANGVLSTARAGAKYIARRL